MLSMNCMRFSLIAIALTLALPAEAFPCSQAPLLDSRRADSVPAMDGAEFPHDGAPLVRLGSGHRDLVDVVRPALFDALGEEVPVAVETRTFPEPVGSSVWFRMFPEEVLPLGETFVIALHDPDGMIAQEELDAVFEPVSFETGPSTLEVARAAPQIEVAVLDHGPGHPPGINPLCGPGGAGEHEHSTTIVPGGADLQTTDHDVVRFIVVSPDLPEDIGQARHRADLDPDSLRLDDAQWASWRYSSPAAGEETQCVISVVEDAYGRTAEADEAICADPVLSCASGCATADARSAGSASLLFGLVAMLGRRRR